MAIRFVNPFVELDIYLI